MSPAPSKSLSSEQLVSILEADPSFTAGLGKGKGPVQTGLTSVKPQKPFSSPAQGVWPGLVSCLLRREAVQRRHLVAKE